MKFQEKLSIILALILVSFGCGGGTTSKTSSMSSFPIAPAIAHFLAPGHAFNYSMSGIIGGVAASGSGTISYGGLITAPFEGQLLIRPDTFTRTISGE